MTNRAPKVVGLGCCTLDVLIRAETLPTWERASRFEEIGFDGGGPAATAMAAVARLGVSAGLIATAGRDEAASLKLRLTERCGVDVSRVVRRDRPDSAVVVVLVNARTGERMFFGGGRGGSDPLRVAELDRAYLAAADYLLVDGLHVEAAVQAARWVRDSGGTVVFDAGTASGGGPLPEHRLALTPHVDVLIAGAGYARAATGLDDIRTAGEKILQMGPRIFVQTDGAGGSHTVAADETFHTPAFEVAVVDTTGAGDVFHGAYIVGLTRGWDLRGVARFASAVAALKCTRLGGRRGIPTFAETTGFLRSRGAEVGPPRDGPAGSAQAESYRP